MSECRSTTRIRINVFSVSHVFVIVIVIADYSDRKKKMNNVVTEMLE